jgi:hypothetical protein
VVELMKSIAAISTLDVGNWKSLELILVGPFIAGSVQMTKLTWSQCLQEILTTLWA